MIRMRLCMFLLLALGASCDKYTCVFDCFLFLESVSASGYVEYQCSGGAGNCCGWENCVAPANALYSSFTRDTLNGPWPSRGTLTPGTICPQSTAESPSGPGGAFYAVGVPSTRAGEFPRNNWPIDGDVEVSCEGQTSTSGCIGNCEFDAIK
mmetsp:Transcript_41529/g.103231  ORF Transcript_41529/g.103231 Transcript_41529/m.103231 type:complete len:152 (-) Transcript_41529:231-686(-)